MSDNFWAYIDSLGELTDEELFGDEAAEMSATVAATRDARHG